jgi:NADH-quinone oxidoreductase subunit D
MFEMITGNRNNYAMFKVGGVRRDIKDEDIPALKKTLDELAPSLNMFYKAINDDPVIKARLKKAGTLTKEQAVDWCVVGPTARASGVNIDVRRDEPYGAFLLNTIDWNVVLEKDGDVFAKTMVRILEMEDSINIINQALNKIPKGEIDANIKDIPPGEGIGRTEAPRGECIHYIKSDGTNRPVRHKIRAPSFMNVASDKVAAVGGTISDATLTLAAVDPCYCCTERVAVINKADNRKILNGWDLVKLSREKTDRIKEGWPNGRPE